LQRAPSVSPSREADREATETTSRPGESPTLAGVREARRSRQRRARAKVLMLVLVSRVIQCRAMANVSIRDLRNHGGEVVDRAARGEAVTITRAGKPVAELRPVSRQPLAAESLLARWGRLPAIDPAALRADIDDVLDARL
jgi:prevent-host-death family protein